MSLGTFGVIDLMTGYQPAAVLTAAARLGVFDVVASSTPTSDEVAARLGLDPPGTRALLDALVGLGLLTSTSGTYAGTADSARLGAGGDLRLVAEKEAFLARVWLDLEESVRTGRPRLDPWAVRLGADPAQCRSFLEALVVLADTTGPDLTRVIPAGSSVLDLGGGLGSYAAPLSATCSVTLVDLPPVAAWARSVLPAPVSVLGLNLLGPSVSLPSSFDVALLSHLLHDLTDDDCRKVLRLAASALRPGGRVVVFELPGDPGDPPGSFGPMFDLMMSVETPGRARRLDELVELVAGAGFVDVAVDASYALPHGVVVGSLRSSL